MIDCVAKMVIVSLNDELKALVFENRYGRYCEDWCLNIDSSRNLVLFQVKHFIAQPESNSIVAFGASGQQIGVLYFKRSDWDSEHFGYNTASLEYLFIKKMSYEEEKSTALEILREFNVWCVKNKIRFIIVKISSMNLPVVHAFEENQFHIIENWIYNCFDLCKLESVRKPEICLRLADNNDLDAMLRFAKGAFVTQRFHADSHITVDQAESLYGKWIKTAMADKKQKTLSMDINGKPVAFMVYYVNDLREYFNLRFAMWKMALIDPSLKHQGIGSDFFAALLHYHREEGMDIVDSGLSSRNILSLNTHIKLNFKVVSTLFTFHKWLQPFLNDIKIPQ